MIEAYMRRPQDVMVKWHARTFFLQFEELLLNPSSQVLFEFYSKRSSHFAHGHSSSPQKKCKENLMTPIIVIKRICHQAIVGVSRTTKTFVLASCPDKPNGKMLGGITLLCLKSLKIEGLKSSYGCPYFGSANSLSGSILNPT